jgi:hypothetical protein
MSEDKNSIGSNGRSGLVERDDQIIAAVDKDAFRAMFYLFAGKPDSKHQTFKGKVTLSPADLVDVNTRIHDKFRLHSITSVITTVSMSLEKNQTLDFGTWAEFLSHDWRDPAAVKDLTIRWDFLIKLESYAQPQRHTLTVNFSGGMTPATMLRVVANAVDSPQDIDVSKMFGGCIARVDFISHGLADELLALIGKWHSLLPTSPSAGTIFEKCEKNDKRIAATIHHSVPMTAAVVAYFGLRYVGKSYDLNSVATVGVVQDFCLWILGTFVLLWASYQVGEFVAQRSYDAITRFGAHHTFRFTSGDNKLVKELAEKNKKSSIRFCWSIAHAIALHVVAGLIVFYLIGKH